MLRKPSLKRWIFYFVWWQSREYTSAHQEQGQIDDTKFPQASSFSGAVGPGYVILERD